MHLCVYASVAIWPYCRGEAGDGQTDIDPLSGVTLSWKYE
jgi:hypothetical protein